MTSALLATLLLAATIPFPDLTGLEPAVAAQLADLPEVIAAAEAAGDNEALGEAGKLYQAYGLLDTAIACYDAALVTVGGEFRWRYLRAKALAAAGKTEAAAAGFAAALEIRPAEVAAGVHRGEALLALGRLADARAAFEATLSTAPETAAAFAGLGQVALSERRFADAVALFERAVELAPQAGALRFPLAMAYRGLGNLDQARRHLELKTTVGVKPPDALFAELEGLKNGARVLMARGFKAFANGDVAAAEQSFRRALAADESLPAARINLAAALERLGRLGEARAELERAVALDPKNATARFNLGQLLSRAGDSAAAAVQLAAAAELRPDDAEARLSLGRELRRLGQFAAAARVAREAIELAPQDENARLEAAGALIDAGRLAEATSLLRAAQQALPASGAIALALTRLLVAAPDPSLRDGALALDLSQRLFEAQPSADHATLVAAALAELDRCDQAAAWQQRALELAETASGGSRRGDSRIAPTEADLLRHYRQERPCRLALAPSTSKP